MLDECSLKLKKLFIVIIDTPYKKVEIFKSVVKKFVKSRPREWFALLGFRAGQVEVNLGFVEYAI
jgi:hypothetical protein